MKNSKPYKSTILYMGQILIIKGKSITYLYEETYFLIKTILSNFSVPRCMKDEECGKGSHTLFVTYLH